MVSDAKFNLDKTQRYSLTRIWGDRNNCVLFIGLNPSTADETNDDPTIRRVIRFAKDWGFGGVIMCNLFTQVTADPKELVIDTPFEITQRAIANHFYQAKMYVAAWGNFKQAEQRGKEVKKWLSQMYALKINKNGSPRHPLYVPANTKPVKFNF